jgi:hypothetical protein
MEDGVVVEIVSFHADLFRNSIFRLRFDGRRRTHLLHGAAIFAGLRDAAGHGCGSEYAYDESDWDDALAVVQRGTLELECRDSTGTASLAATYCMTLTPR